MRPVRADESCRAMVAGLMRWGGQQQQAQVGAGWRRQAQAAGSRWRGSRQQAAAAAGSRQQLWRRPQHTSQSSTSRIRAENIPLPDLIPLPSGVGYDCSVNDEALRRGIHLCSICRSDAIVTGFFSTSLRPCLRAGE